jgi:tripartite-type tricarboxylate transporter receptor subunit TctC
MLIAGVAAAQAFPARPIRLVVGFPPGGAVDLIARTIGPGMADALGQQVVVDNRPGANGIIGTEAVARAAPDGHTIGLASISTMVLNVHLYPKLSYHTHRDFTPVSTVGLVPFAIAVHPAVPARSVGSLVALARTHPGKLSFGSPGVGGLQHLTIEMLNSMAKVRIQHVPYKGTGPAMTDLLGGHIDGVIGGVSGVVGPVRAGKLIVLAVTAEVRSLALPDVPTAREQGLPGLVAVNWYAIVGPPNLTPQVVDALHGAVVKAAATPGARDKFAAAGVDVKTDASSAAFAQYVRTEFVRWGKVLQETGVKID